MAFWSVFFCSRPQKEGSGRSKSWSDGQVANAFGLSFRFCGIGAFQEGPKRDMGFELHQNITCYTLVRGVPGAVNQTCIKFSDQGQIFSSLV
jgi:hypothetical protein